MKVSSHIREVIIQISSYLGIVRLCRIKARKHGPLVRVLVFHDVKDGEWFENIIKSIRHTYNLISYDDFRTGRFDTEKINVLITFDDGYISWMNTCLPTLRKYGVEAVFFVNSGLINLSHDTEAQGRYVREKLLLSPRQTLSWDGVRKLKEEGHTIGGHTVHHEHLSLLSSEAQVEEIVNDKKIIEQEIGEPINVFAYPFGNVKDYTEVTILAVRTASYSHAFTTAGEFAHPGNNPYAVSRMCVEDNQTFSSLSRWIDGGYDVYRSVKKLCAR